MNVWASFAHLRLQCIDLVIKARAWQLRPRGSPELCERGKGYEGAGTKRIWEMRWVISESRSPPSVRHQSISVFSHAALTQQSRVTVLSQRAEKQPHCRVTCALLPDWKSNKSFCSCSVNTHSSSWSSFRPHMILFLLRIHSEILLIILPAWKKKEREEKKRLLFPSRALNRKPCLANGQGCFQQEEKTTT